MIKQFTIQDMENLRLGKEIYTGDEKEIMRLYELFGKENLELMDQKKNQKELLITEPVLKLMVEILDLNPAKILEEKKKSCRLLTGDDIKDQRLTDGYIRSKKDIFKVLDTEYKYGSEYVVFEPMSALKKCVFVKQNQKKLTIKKENILYYSEHLLDLIFSGDLVVYRRSEYDVRNGILVEKADHRALIYSSDFDYKAVDETDILKVHFQEFFK